MPVKNNTEEQLFAELLTLLHLNFPQALLLLTKGTCLVFVPEEEGKEKERNLN